MTDIREEMPHDAEEAFRAAIRGHLLQLWTSAPAIISEDTKDGHVAKITVALKRKHQDDDGKINYENYPELIECPIKNHQGGKMVHTMPTLKGDEVHAVFSCRPIDTWHEAGGTDNNPLDTRMHNLTDGFVHRGVRSNPRKLNNVAKQSSQVRSEDLSQYHDLHPTNGHSLLSKTPPQNGGGQQQQKNQQIVTLKHDTGILGNSTNLIQHVVCGKTSTTMKKDVISHKAQRVILLNC
jgi:Phage protein Gp138 N-terminal domain